ncbi:hypothetical protein RchiOBHm_Chr7g0204221 [Rosa chinensis]|uniref:Uncharacterized protein n=1 Tax=Rosa chinensis TaxID=74649 RepID=A0A2P6P8P1_ROSCH|nr:hypothetical protein RchiOBHm_Chr7g0204221 [Rosa chinensis]
MPIIYLVYPWLLCDPFIQPILVYHNAFYMSIKISVDSVLIKIRTNYMILFAICLYQRRVAAVGGSLDV